MKYCSTRGSEVDVSFEETLFSGWLNDGGVFVPQEIPFVDMETKLRWKKLAYSELSYEIIRLFVDRDFIDDLQLRELLDVAVSSFHAEVIELKPLTRFDFVLELFHGPTLSFKDLSMAFVGPLLNYALARQGKKALICVNTSGDTGSAAIHACRNKNAIHAIVLYPGNGRISKFQEQLMTTVGDKNIQAFSGDAYCDQFEFLISEVPKYLKKSRPDMICTSLNSITWCRILGQIVHQVYCYLKVSPDLTSAVRFVVPTGGGGHITSGMVAQAMGFDIKFVAAFNIRNANLYNLLQGGVMTSHSSTRRSLCPAIDMQMACNLERWLYLASKKNVVLVSALMKQLNSDGLKLPSSLLDQLRELVEPYCCQNSDILDVMAKCWRDFNYMIDPHTAVGLSLFYEQRKTGRADVATSPTVYFAPASPKKFPDELKSAGIPLPEEFTRCYGDMDAKETFARFLPDREDEWLSFLQAYIETVL